MQNYNSKIKIIKTFNFLLVLLTFTFLLLALSVVEGLTSPAYASHCPVDETHTDFGCIANDPFKFTTSIYGIGLGFVGGVALLSIVYGAFLVLSSQGDPGKLNTGRSYIVYALIGMGLAAGGFAFYRIIAANVIKIPGFN